jgi:cytochrome oxidase Cu insertion factor (SCO1/SenC/PrrC family)
VVIPAALFALALAAYVPLLQPGDTVPAIPLVDQTGRAFSLAGLRGNAVIVTFMYTRCADPQMCPLASAKFERLQSLAHGAPVRLLEITLDPAYDSPAVLRAYGHAFHADARRWQLATGAAGAIDELAQRFGIATRWSRPGTLVHTEAVAVLDRQGRLVQTIDGNAWQPGDVLAVARASAGASGSFASRVALALNAAIELCGGRSGPSALALFGLLGVTLIVSLTLMLRAIAPRVRR